MLTSHNSFLPMEHHDNHSVPHNLDCTSSLTREQAEILDLHIRQPWIAELTPVSALRHTTLALAHITQHLVSSSLSHIPSSYHCSHAHIPHRLLQSNSLNLNLHTISTFTPSDFSSKHNLRHPKRQLLDRNTSPRRLVRKPLRIFLIHLLEVRHVIQEDL